MIIIHYYKKLVLTCVSLDLSIGIVVKVIERSLSLSNTINFNQLLKFLIEIL